MTATILLVLAAGLQLVAAYMSLRLVRLTRGRVAWLLIAAGLVLVTIRRVLDLISIAKGIDKGPTMPDVVAAIIASLCFIAGLSAIGPLFAAAIQGEEMLRKAHGELEKRVQERTAELAQSVADLRQEVAQRQQAQQALRESEERYRQLFASELDAIMLFDAETLQIIDANEAATRLYGYEMDEFLGMTGAAFSAEPKQTLQSMRQTLDEGNSRVMLRWHRKKDGTVFPVEIHSSSFMLGGRKVICGSSHDITKRITAQEALRAAHRQLIVAREEERRRLSRELHDSVGQQIVAAGLKLRALETELKRCAYDAAAGPLAELVAQHRQLSEDVRRVSRALYPMILEELGLAAALRQLQNDMACPETAVEANSPPEIEGARFGREVEIAFYRIAQEALTNALRHGKCRQVFLDLDFEQGQLHLSVIDDGCGFNPDKAGAGQGLHSMRERTEAIGATLEITSEPGRSCVRVQLAAQPIASPSQQQ